MVSLTREYSNARKDMERRGSSPAENTNYKRGNNINYRNRHNNHQYQDSKSSPREHRDGEWQSDVIKPGQSYPRRETFKTGLCHAFTHTGKCKYGNSCQYAHGKEELRQRKFPSPGICFKIASGGLCPYGERCRFSHDVEDQESVTDVSSEEMASDHFSSEDGDSASVQPEDGEFSNPEDDGSTMVDEYGRWPRGQQKARSSDSNSISKSSSRANENGTEKITAISTQPLRAQTSTQSSVTSSTSTQFPLSMNMLSMRAGQSVVPTVYGANGSMPVQSLYQGTRQYSMQQPMVGLGLHSVANYSSPFQGTAYYTRLLSLEAEEYLRRLDEKMVFAKKLQKAAVESLRREVQTIWPTATVEVFGSASTDLSMPNSDIDIVISRQTEGAKDDPNCVVETLRGVHDHLAEKSHVKGLKLLDKAAIPVLKFIHVDDLKEVSMDITCSNTPQHTGYRARELVQEFVQQLPALRPLVLILKLFLESKDLKNPFTGGISSYAIVLLVARFLQSCGAQQTAYAPNCDPSTDPNSSIFPSVSTYVFHQTGGVWHAEIGALLLRLVHFYSTFTFNDVGVSVTDGGRYFRLDERHESQFSQVPWIDDPLCPGRNVCTTCFRISEVRQAIGDLYDSLLKRVPLDQLLETNNQCSAA